VSEAESQYRFYAELAHWWPLISPPEDYREESAYIGWMLTRAALPVRSVLELGSGGGHVAFHLKGQFALTLVDVSEEMLAVSTALNPDCEHRVGDMRTVRLDRQFDAVLIYDAIDYMKTEVALGQAIATSFVHCRPGGVGLFVPDHLAENFLPDADHGGSDDPSGRGVRYLEWSRDSDPADTEIETAHVFLLREADGSTRLVHETHHTGLFPRDDWLRLLREAGFEPEVVVEETTEDRSPRELFVGHRPL